MVRVLPFCSGTRFDRLANVQTTTWSCLRGLWFAHVYTAEFLPCRQNPLRRGPPSLTPNRRQHCRCFKQNIDPYLPPVASGTRSLRRFGFRSWLRNSPHTSWVCLIFRYPQAARLSFCFPLKNQTPELPVFRSPAKSD